MVEITAKGSLNVRVNKADQDFEINLSKIAPAGLAYLVQYGLRQSLNDAAAGAQDQPEAQGKAQMRLDAILAGTMGQRRNGTRQPADPVEAEAKHLAQQRVKAAIRAKGKTLKEVGRAKVEEMTEKVLEAEKDKLLALAKKNVECASKGGADMDTMLADL